MTLLVWVAAVEALVRTLVDAVRSGRRMAQSEGHQLQVRAVVVALGREDEAERTLRGRPSSDRDIDLG